MDSVAEKVNVATSLLPAPDGPESIAVSGEVLSTVIVRLDEVPELDAASTARAVMVAVPSLTVFEFQIR